MDDTAGKMANTAGKLTVFLTWLCYQRAVNLLQPYFKYRSTARIFNILITASSVKIINIKEHYQYIYITLVTYLAF
jgi:hypothetical protein